MIKPANTPSRHRRQATAGLIVPFLVASVVNISLLVINEPPLGSVSETQYQRPWYTVSAAIYFVENGACGLAAWLAGRIEILAGARVG